jgi:ferric-dicitrate binding protein FerR (iron transport regulator)
VLTDGTQLKLNYNTDITLRDKDSKGKASARGIGSIKLTLGDLWAKVTKKNSRLEFDTPAAVAAVKGTEPLLSVSQDGGLCVKLREGSLELLNDLGAAKLGELEQICLKKGGPLSDSMKMKWDGVKDSFDGGFGGATKADVLIRYLDEKGEPTELKLEYTK